MFTTGSLIMEINNVIRRKMEKWAKNFTNKVVYDKIFIEKVKIDKYYSETFIAYYDTKLHI